MEELETDLIRPRGQTARPVDSGPGSRWAHWHGQPSGGRGLARIPVRGHGTRCCCMHRQHPLPKRFRLRGKEGFLHREGVHDISMLQRCGQDVLQYHHILRQTVRRPRHSIPQHGPVRMWQGQGRIHKGLIPRIRERMQIGGKDLCQIRSRIVELYGNHRRRPAWYPRLPQQRNPHPGHGRMLAQTLPHRCLERTPLGFRTRSIRHYPGCRQCPRRGLRRTTTPWRNPGVRCQRRESARAGVEQQKDYQTCTNAAMTWHGWKFSSQQNMVAGRIQASPVCGSGRAGLPGCDTVSSVSNANAGDSFPVYVRPGSAVFHPTRLGTASIPLILFSDVSSGHAAGHQVHEVAGSSLDLQPRVKWARGLKRPNQPSSRLVFEEGD